VFTACGTKHRRCCKRVELKIDILPLKKKIVNLSAGLFNLGNLQQTNLQIKFRHIYVFVKILI